MSAGALCSTLGGYPRNRRSLYGNQNPAGSALDASQSDRNNPLDRASPMPLRRTSRTIEDRMDILPPGAPKLEEILLDSDAMPWREKSLKGVSEKMLWRNAETGAR
jgi:hypothetical protein